MTSKPKGYSVSRGSTIFFVLEIEEFARWQAFPASLRDLGSERLYDIQKLQETPIKERMILKELGDIVGNITVTAVHVRVGLSQIF